MGIPDLVILGIKKSVRPMQVVLNDFMDDKAPNSMQTITASAYSQARAKLSYMAFKELTYDTVDFFYKNEEDLKTWKGFTVYAVDGSTCILPESEDIKNEFYITHNHNQTSENSYIKAHCSVLYDVLNNIAIDGEIVSSEIGERILAKNHLSKLPKNQNNLVLYDRGYLSYEIFASHKIAGANYVVRIAQNCFKIAEELFDKNCIIDSKTVVLISRNNNAKKDIEEKKLPVKIKVRFVRIVLDNGEIEVLATSLFDKEKFPTSCFKELYNLRWNVETFYDILKNRLSLENFTGKTAESVKQDFHVTLLISNIETFFISEAQNQLDEKVKRNNNNQRQKVNKNVSFSLLKDKAMDILYDENKNPGKIFEELTKLFQIKPNCIREDRVQERKKTTLRKSLNYQKKRRKHLY